MVVAKPIKQTKQKNHSTLPKKRPENKKLLLTIHLRVINEHERAERKVLIFSHANSFGSCSSEEVNISNKMSLAHEQANERERETLLFRYEVKVSFVKSNDYRENIKFI